MLFNQDLWMKVQLPVTYVVTTNAFVKKTGELVMGRGAAFQATQRIPGIAKEAADVINAHSKSYGYLPVLEATEAAAGFSLFQVKLNWWDDADLELIRISTGVLLRAATDNPEMKFRLNYPGIGNGNLNRELVAPIIRELTSHPMITVVYRKDH